jgi:hypothetical protein
MLEFNWKILFLDLVSCCLLFILNQTSLVKIFVSLLGCSVLRVSCSLASVQIKADSCRRFSLLALGFLTVAISSRFLHFTFPSAHGSSFSSVCSPDECPALIWLPAVWVSLRRRDWRWPCSSILPTAIFLAHRSAPPPAQLSCFGSFPLCRPSPILGINLVCVVCELLQEEVSCVFELPDQKTQGFYVLIALTWWFFEYAPKLFHEVPMRT